MTVERLFLHGKEIVLVGTAHVSAESIKLVRETIAKEKPDVVGVELDHKRLEQLKQQHVWRETNLAEIIKKGNHYIFLLNVLLASFQRRIGRELGIKPGEEMLAAIKAAADAKVPVALLDRDVSITLKRAFASMKLFEKLRIGYSILTAFFGQQEKLKAEQIEELKKKDTLSALMEELSREAPGMKRVLVDERDHYIANRILHAPGKKIVAVVGAGHIEGIKKHLSEKKPIEHLLLLPKQTLVDKIKANALTILIVAIILYGFYKKGLSGGLQFAVWWFLSTGVGAAVGTLLTRGHLKTVIVAFFTAFLAALHPLIAVGWIVALVEMKIQSPKVKDFEELQNVAGIKDLFKNRVTHILLIAAAANVGSIVASVIIMPYILAHLA